MKDPILPGATLGVLGSGQLGRMFAIAARQMGYRVHTFSPDRDSPTGQVADVEVTADYDDVDAVRSFARTVDVVTFEFENVSHAAASAAAEVSIVRPAGSVLHTTQNRLREKTFLRDHGFPVTPFAAVHSSDELRDALNTLGYPAVLKTAGFGYDGKGQSKIEGPAGAEAAMIALGAQDAILEAWIDYTSEVSVIGVRGSDGAFTHFGPVGNTHSHHILDITVSPAGIPEDIAADAVAITRAVLDALDVVGVLCVEFFVTSQGTLLINEVAPRPHNSGHYTIDACATSQFEQQVRAICGLPLGSTRQHRPAAMANLLGDIWSGGEPDWAGALALPGVKLHLYGKAEPRAGRKMGHITALADSPEEAVRTVRAARSALTGNSGMR